MSTVKGMNEKEKRIFIKKLKEAGEKGVPLCKVFEKTARKTGLSCGSVRNYYYRVTAKKNSETFTVKKRVLWTKKEENELAEDEEIAEITSIDLVYIVNALKDAGAEAISINGDRIVNTTDMADVGGSIKINSRYLRTDTYEVKAIGNSAYLESSLFGKGGFVEQLDISGIKSDIERSKKVTISKYTGDFETKYMQEKESKNNE